MEEKKINIDRFGIELPATLRQQMKVSAAQRGIKLSEAYASACSLWTGDAQGVAAELLEAYYSGSSELNSPLRMVLGILREKKAEPVSVAKTSPASNAARAKRKTG